MSEKGEEATGKYIDWWAKHSIGTRYGLIVTFLLLAYAIVGDKSEATINILSDMALIAFMTVTIGANALIEIAKMYFGSKK